MSVKFGILIVCPLNVIPKVSIEILFSKLVIRVDNELSVVFKFVKVELIEFNDVVVPRINEFNLWSKLVLTDIPKFVIYLCHWWKYMNYNLYLKLLIAISVAACDKTNPTTAPVLEAIAVFCVVFSVSFRTLYPV